MLGIAVESDRSVEYLHAAHPVNPAEGISVACRISGLRNGPMSGLSRVGRASHLGPERALPGEFRRTRALQPDL